MYDVCYSSNDFSIEGENTRRILLRFNCSLFVDKYRINSTFINANKHIEYELLDF